MATGNTKAPGGEALGFVEVFGLTAAVEAADAMGKAARVKIKSVANADAGILCVVCEGDIAACRAAIDAGKASAERMGRFLTSNLIARPYDDGSALLTNMAGSMFTKKAAPGKPSKAKA